MEIFVLVLILSVLVQFIVERFKVFTNQLPDATKKWVVPFIALIIAEIVCIFAKVGLFGMLGISLEPLFIDYILTGIIASGGSSAVNELIKSLMAYRQAQEPQISIQEEQTFKTYNNTDE